MTKDFGDIIRQDRKSKFDAVAKQADTLNSSGNYAKDETYFLPEIDKSGGGYVLMRFLEAGSQEGEDDVWKSIYSHSFQNPNTGKWYINNCLSSIGKEDPVLQFNKKLWDRCGGKSANRNHPDRIQVSEQKRKQSFISNVYIINHPARPADNGKVFRYKYGKKILEKITDQMTPPAAEAALREKVNPFSFLFGANFHLRIAKVDGQRNYDKSGFDATSPLFVMEKDGKTVPDLKSIEGVWRSEYPLNSEVGIDKFKTYDELRARLIEVLGESPFDDGPVEAKPITKPTFAKPSPVVAKPAEVAPTAPADPPWEETAKAVSAEAQKAPVKEVVKNAATDDVDEEWLSQLASNGG